MSSSHSRHETALTQATWDDLLWAIHSPMLCGQHPPHFARWAQESIDHALVSQTLSRQRRVPIGRYFEALVETWLASRTGLSNLAANVPIRSEGNTLGEADLLFAAGDKCYHWELAIKFYIGTGDRLDPASWYGPKGRDRLDLKLKKLSEQQLQLMQRPEAQPVLATHGLQAVESHALVKGYLFHPYADWEQDHTPVPPDVNPGHAKGWWLHHSDVSKIAERSGHWRCLAKQEWLAPARGGVTIRAQGLRSWLNDYFANDDRPPMLAALDEAGNEIERGFVVPDHWAPSPR